MKLYEIKSELDKVINDGGIFVSTETGEILDTAALDALHGELSDKLDSIGAYVKDLQASAAAHREQMKYQAEAAKADEAKAQRLIEYVRQNVPEGKRFKLLRCDWRWRKSEAVEVTDESAVPEAFRKVAVSVDKAAAKKAMKEGQTVPGLALKEKISLSVK